MTETERGWRGKKAERRDRKKERWRWLLHPLAYSTSPCSSQGGCSRQHLLGAGTLTLDKKGEAQGAQTPGPGCADQGCRDPEHPPLNLLLEMQILN